VRLPAVLLPPHSPSSTFLALPAAPERLAARATAAAVTELEALAAVARASPTAEPRPARRRRGWASTPDQIDGGDAPAERELDQQLAADRRAGGPRRAARRRPPAICRDPLAIARSGLATGGHDTAGSNLARRSSRVRMCSCAARCATATRRSRRARSSARAWAFSKRSFLALAHQLGVLASQPSVLLPSSSVLALKWRHDVVQLASAPDRCTSTS
jgi:hypothetical protein